MRLFDCVLEGFLVLFGNLVRVLFQGLFDGEHQLFGAVLRVDELLSLLVLFGVLLGVLDCRFDVAFGKIAGGGYRYGLRLVGALVHSLDGHYAVGVDVERDFNLRHSAGCGSDTRQFESAQSLVVPCKLSLTLQHVNVDGGLVVCSRREHLRLAGGDSGVAVDEFGEHSA